MPPPEELVESVTAKFRGPPPDQQAAELLFEQAADKFRAAAQSAGKERQSAFRQAAKLYAAAAERGKGFPIAEDALLMVGESYFFADDYPKATTAYGVLTKLHPTTRHLDRADKRRFEIAKYWLQRDDESALSLLPNLSDKTEPVTDTFGHAVKLFDRIRFDDPTGKLSDDATMAAAVANFESEKYAAADELFTDLRENFPSSEHQFQAHLLGLKCKLVSYAGPEYDGTAISEGEKLVKNMFGKFPKEAAEHRELLENAFRDIRLKQANREFKLAKYYDRRHEYRAARMHYELVRDEYPDTNLALESESRLAQIEGLPDVPPQRLQWLADLFPDEGRVEPLLQPRGAKSK